MSIRNLFIILAFMTLSALPSMPQIGLQSQQYGERIVRLAEIEVEPEFLEDYMAFAKEVGETSVKVEPGVLTLFSMQAKEDPCKIYILEIYADQEAYQSHIQTAHFKKYKEGTAKMVKSLKLIDVNPLAGMIH